MHEKPCLTSILRPFLETLYTERKKKRRVNFIPKFHSSLKKFVKYLLWLQNGICMEQKFQISLVSDQQVSSYWSSLVATPQILKSKSNWKSISGVPPLAAVAALILLWIELTKALTVRIGMLFHSSINAFLSCARVAGGGGGGGMSALPNPSVQLILHVLYWGQIWTVRWPC